MRIEFAGPAMPAQDGGIFYRAIVDGTTVACHFSASRTRLLALARKKIEEGEFGNGVAQIVTQDLR